MKDRIYVCHTFYHVYVSFLKELALPQEKQGKATLVISHMSTDFGAFPDRIRSLSFFEDVVDFDEKGEKDFPELQEYRQNSGFVKNLIQRIKYTKRLAELEEPYPSSTTRLKIFCTVGTSSISKDKRLQKTRTFSRTLF